MKNNSTGWAKVAEGVELLNEKYGAHRVAAEAAVSVLRIIKALDEFIECVRYLNTRRTKATVLSLDSEAAVQDAIFLMLRPWILDLVPESPTERIANRYSIRDFVSRSAGAIIEAKYIRDAFHGKSISKELHDDIETYQHHPFCRDLVFFIYDPDAHIPDRAALQRQIVVERIYDGVPLRCSLVVKP